MALIRSITNFYEGIITVGNFLQHLFLLAIRLYWGWAFHLAGCQKFEDIEKVAGFFGSMGIPFPELNAYFVATLECVGGWCLIFGFASRLISLPLAITMAVALITAHAAGASEILNNPPKFLVELPVSYLLTSLTVFVFGPGWISIDFLIEKLIIKKSKSR
ncbi:MAG: DoxX family protein [Chlamydiota bacterium]